MLNIQIQFFALCREKSGCHNTSIQLDDGATLADAKRTLLDSFPEFHDFSGSLLFAVNGNYVEESHVLNDGDAIACFPPVSGG